MALLFETLCGTLKITQWIKETCYLSLGAYYLMEEAGIEWVIYLPHKIISNLNLADLHVDKSSFLIYVVPNLSYQKWPNMNAESKVAQVTWFFKARGKQI